MGSGPYIALIGDIVGSREIENRREVQAKLEKLLRNENMDACLGMDRDILSALSITSGDEIQGLFRGPERAIAIVERMTRLMYPVRMVFGLGRGEVSTAIDPENPGRTDGPCFHNARNALQQARDEYQGHLAFEGFGAGGIHLSNQADLIHFIESRWTPRQREFINALEDGVQVGSIHGTGSQRHVAAYFHVSPPTVSESLKAAGYQRVKDAYADVRIMSRAIHNGNLRWVQEEGQDD